MRNQVQLITYPDSLGGSLVSLDRALRASFPDVFPGGIHILPPFPSSGDRGFAPLTYAEIEPAFGTWDDIRRLNENGPVALDLMVNHMSRQSPAFRDFLKRGRHSPFADMFIPPGKIWPGGSPPEKDIDRLFLRRSSPFSRYRIRDTGEEVTLWTTFGKQDPSEQIDLDWKSPAYRRFIADALEGFHRHGISMIRLDAVGYVVKKPGTSCFFVEPEIYEFLNWLRGLADPLGMELLPEVHASLEIQEALARHGFWIYDFVLPYTILEAFLTGEPDPLRSYLSRRPARQLTMLDCHDGIPIKPDLDGLYDVRQARRVVDICLERGANLSRILSPAHRDADGFDVHQVRCSYYSALGEDEDAYLAARAIQFFAPGVPQVYYVGLLSGRNDDEAVRRTGEGREINRHNYSASEIETNASRGVVQRLVRLIRFRNTHRAFNGAFRVLGGRKSELRMEWQKDGAACALTVDFALGRGWIEHVDAGGSPVREPL
jgi:sucrose phosphorylase